MSAWQLGALGDLVERARTWSPASDAPNEEFIYVDISALDQESKRILGQRAIMGRTAPSRARQLVRAGDVLVSTVRPNLNGVARVPKNLDGATASTGFCILRARKEVLHSGYLFHWVKSPWFINDMVSKANGASYPAVSDRIIFESLVPLPPIAEQERIAELLDRVESLRSKRRCVLAHLDELIPAIFVKVLGDPIANEKGWNRGRLGDVATFIGGGTPSRSRPEFFEGTICWATSKDMKAEFLDDTQEHITQEAIEQSSTKLVPPGTILVVVKSKILAHSLPVTISRVPTCFGQDLKGIQVAAHCDVTFVAWAIRLGKKWLLEKARGANTEGLTLDHLREFPLIFPPLSLQQEFARRVATIEKLKAAQGASLAELDALFASLQHRAFRGEL